jgi:hypothetical protein
MTPLDLLMKDEKKDAELIRFEKKSRGLRLSFILNKKESTYYINC